MKFLRCVYAALSYGLEFKLRQVGLAVKIDIDSYKYFGALSESSSLEYPTQLAKS